MPDIFHRLPVRHPIAGVFAMFATPAGLDAWWTLTAEGTAAVGARWVLDFGPGYRWTAVVTVLDPPRAIEWQMLESDHDWIETRVGAHFTESDGVTTVDFEHTGWRAPNAHFRTTNYCWAMYLRVLRGVMERGERVAYTDRLDV